MRQKILSLIFLSSLLVLSHQHYGQKIKRLSLSVMNESIALPGTRLSPMHPGIEFGLILHEKSKSKTERLINAYAGYYYHQNISNAFYLKGEYILQLNLHKHFGLDLISGLGYMHTFYPTQLYELNNVGEFEEISQIGRPHLIADIGIGLTYLNKSKFEPFVKYDFMIETPFANGIPVIPHSLFKLGVNYKLNNNENE